MWALDLSVNRTRNVQCSTPNIQRRFWLDLFSAKGRDEAVKPSNLDCSKPMKQDHLSVVLGTGLALAVMERSHAAQPGEKLWEFQSGTGNALVRATPAITTEGIVVVGSTDGYIYGLDGATGQKRWELRTHGEVRAAAAIGADGTAYAGATDDRVYAVDTTTGTPRWSSGVEGDVISSPALGGDGTVYVAAGKLYALSGATGQKRWEFSPANEVFSSPAVGSDGTVYAGSDKVYALSGATGQKRWDGQRGFQ